MMISQTDTPALDKTATTIEGFIRDELESAKLSNVVIGLSGGIDSALASTLAARALGADAVLGVMMPYATSTPSSVDDARKLAAWLGIETTMIDITPMIERYYVDGLPDPIRAGNKMARERMSILFDLAWERNALVVGTGNRTEIALGYTTLFGDAACSFNPIGQLYKTEVRSLSAYLGIPASIITKPPSADLWVDQTDEDEIGVTYDVIDRILVRLLDDHVRDQATLLADGFTAEEIDRVVGLMNQNSFKRRSARIAALGKGAIPEQLTLT